MLLGNLGRLVRLWLHSEHNQPVSSYSANQGVWLHNTHTKVNKPCAGFHLLDE